MCSLINGPKKAKVGDDIVARIMSHTSDFIDYNDDKCFSNDGLYLLSNVAVEEINNTNIKKEKDRTSLTINNNNNNNNNNKNMKESFSDGWDVFRCQISEEHRLKTKFNNAEEFLYHWLVELKGCKENSRLRPLFMNVKKFKWNNMLTTVDYRSLPNIDNSTKHGLTKVVYPLTDIHVFYTDYLVLYYYSYL